MNKLLQSLSALGVSATLVTPNLNADATTNTTPQIKGANDIVIKKGQDYNLLNGISAFDKEDGDLTNKISLNGSVDTSNAGSYKINYSVTDSKNKTVTKQITITVEVITNSSLRIIWIQRISQDMIYCTYCCSN